MQMAGHMLHEIIAEWNKQHKEKHRVNRAKAKQLRREER